MASTKKFWYERQNGPSLITLLALGPAPEETLKKLKCLFHATNDICKVTNRKYYVTCTNPETTPPFTLPDDMVAKQNMCISFQASIKATFLGQMFDAISEVPLGKLAARDPALWYYLLAAGHNEFGKTTTWFNRSLMARLHVNAETAAGITLNTKQYETMYKQLAEEELLSVNTENSTDLMRRYILTRGQRDKDIKRINEKIKQTLQPMDAKKITVNLLQKRRVWYCYDSFFERAQFEEFKDESGVYYLFVCSRNRGPTRLFAQLSPFSNVTILVHILNCEERSYLYYSPYIERLVADFLKINSGDIELVLLDETGPKKLEIKKLFEIIRSKKPEIDEEIKNFTELIDKLSAGDFKNRKEQLLTELQTQNQKMPLELKNLEERLNAEQTLDELQILLEETYTIKETTIKLKDLITENIIDVGAQLNLSGSSGNNSGGDSPAI